MNRKRCEGLSLKGGKEGWGFVLGGAALRSFGKERISESHSLQPFLSIRREKVNMIFALVFPTKLSTFFFIIRKALFHKTRRLVVARLCVPPSLLNPEFLL